MTSAIDKDLLSTLCASPAQINVPPDLTVDQVAGVARALIEESYPVLEILGRPMEKALPLLHAFNERPERSRIAMAVGTILTRRHAEQAVAAKPDLLVSPAFSRRVLEVAVEAGIPYIPAVSTLQDIQDVLDAYEDVGWELRVLKACPLNWITPAIMDMIARIYPTITFCPTGTVELEDIPLLKARSWMGAPMEQWFLERAWIDDGNWDRVRERLREIRRLAEAGEANRE